MESNSVCYHIRAINKIQRLGSRSLICLITSMITDLNTTRDISKLSQITSNNFEISLMVFMPNTTILIMLLPILIILVIKQIGLPLRGRPILLITCMITHRIGLHSVLLCIPLWIGRHQVLLPINHNYNKICNIWGFF